MPRRALPAKRPRRGAGKQADVLRLDRHICFSLYAASRLLTRLYQPLLEPLGLSYPQYVVLMVLWEDSPCSVGHICRRALLNTNTLTPLLRRLEQAGYLRRRRNDDDERIVNIELTAAGRALQERCSCVPEEVAGRASAFPLQKALMLKALCDEMIASLQAPANDGHDG